MICYNFGMKQNQKGIAHLSVLIIGLILIAGVGFAVWRVAGAKNEKKPASAAVTAKPTDSANSCSQPVLPVPTDITKVTAVLYPGQSRGGNYKPHGGFRFDNSANADISVKIPVDAKLIDGSRYIEAGETQYMFDFEASCQIRIRFDHLAVLSSALQAEANKLPEPKADDSRTTNLSGVTFKAGDIIATSVGFSKTKNVSFDFGVYDMTNKNAKSSDSAWASAHSSDNEQHAVCWLDWLSPQDKATLQALPGGDQSSGKTSDYCQ
jgi:hypothetical protein